MTISSTATRKEYIGNGVTTAFSFPYPFETSTDLRVFERTIATGAIVEKTTGTDFTVTGAGNPSGGTVTATTAPANTVNWIIVRDPARTQGVALVNGEKIDVAAAINSPLDALTLQVQRQNDRNDRALHAPDGDLTANAAMELPNSVARAGKWLGFDGAGLPVALAAVPNGESVGAFTKKYFSSPYATLDDADTAASGASAQLSIDGDTTLAADQEFSSPVAFEGGRIIRGSHAVTFNSEAALGARPAFDASGTGLVTFVRTPRIYVGELGVKGDGTTDDANALSQALLSAKASKSVLFGNNSIVCNLKSQITIPPNIIFDADGLCLTPDATLTSNALAVVDGAQPGYTGELRGEINGLHLLQALTSNHADTSKNVDGLQLGSTNGAYQLKISDLDVQGFRCALVVEGPNVYIIDFYNIILANGWKRLISHDTGSNTGERFTFHGGTLANCSNTSFDGTALLISSTTANKPDYSFHGTSFDYNDVSVDMAQGNVSCFGCHFENNNNNPHVKTAKTSGKFAPRFEAHGGQITGGPGVVSWSGISTEDADGRAALITTTGGDATIIIQGVECGNFITTSSPGSPPAYKTEIVKNTDGIANRVVDLRPVLSSLSTTSGGLPPTLSNSLNDIYLGASGSTTGWDTTNIGSGNTLAADTTAGKFQSPDTGGRKITCASGNSGTIFQTVNVAGKRRVIAKAWIATDTTFTSGEVDIRLQFYSSKGDLISDQTSARTMTATNAGPTEISQDIPVPTGAYTMKANIHWGSLPSGGIFWTSNEHVWPY